MKHKTLRHQDGLESWQQSIQRSPARRAQSNVFHVTAVTAAELLGQSREARIVLLERALDMSQNIATGNLGIGMAVICIPAGLYRLVRRRRD